MPSRLTTRTSVSAIAAAAFGGALVFSPATAGAITPQDEQFTKIVSALDIPVQSQDQAIKLGNDICTLVAQGRAQTIDPVRTVRGVVGTLTKQGLSKAQAVPLLRAAVTLYCPEHAQILGR